MLHDQSIEKLREDYEFFQKDLTELIKLRAEARTRLADLDNKVYGFEQTVRDILESISVLESQQRILISNEKFKLKE